MRKGQSTGIRLPESIQDKINEKESDSHHRGPGKRKVNRKELRKQERSAKKQRKAEHFSQTKTSVQYVEEVKPTKRTAEEWAESPIRKRARSGPAPNNLEYPRPSSVSDARPSNSSAPPSKLRPETTGSRTKPPAAPLRSLPKSRVEEEEERYIRFLEKQLGYHKGKAKQKSNPDEDDGLDDLLDFADNLNETLAETLGQHTYGDEGSDTYGEDVDLEGEEESESDGNLEDFYTSDESESEGDDEDEEWGGIQSREQESHAKDTHPTPIRDPALGTTYVPPHLRKVQDNQSEAQTKLTRQLKGLLNRMSEQNIGSILDSIEDMYRDNSRNDVTSSLTNLIVDGVSSHSVLLDSYVVLHAAFVSALHKLVGIEFAAHFVQHVVSIYEKHHVELALPSLSQEEDAPDRGKECSNLIVLLSELYNFQVISSVLMFDLIRDVLKGEMSEFSVELLLKVLRNSGQQLRTDDPLALKDIVTVVQERVSGKEGSLSSRTRFMIETLTNLKNNKVKKLGEQNQGGAAVDRMKKFLSGLTKTRHVLSHEPLRVSLEDLHSANTKGKWWLVGAAWGGDPLVDRQAAIEQLSVAQKSAREEENDLVKLARKQGMNSDIRRSIFVVLMSSEDYVDACDRLSQLNLTEVQRREIIRVLLHCCGNEKSYNPYYALVAQELCRKSHSYKITVQFCLWDFLRDLGEAKVGGAELVKNVRDEGGFDVKNISRTRMNNVARCYAWWIAKDSVQLGILKPVDFTMLKPRTKDFLKELLVHVLINSQLSTPFITSNTENITLTRQRGTIEEVFIKATRTDTVAMGLVYFMTEAFRDTQAHEDDLSKFLAWAVALAKETLQTGLDVIPAL